MNTLWGRLFRKYPWLFLGSTWVVIVMLGVLSAKILYSPGSDPPITTASTAPIVASPFPSTSLKTSQNTEAFPLWSLGFIVISCALSSLMISQRLKQPSRPRNLLD